MSKVIVVSGSDEERENQLEKKETATAKESFTRETKKR